MKNRREFLRLAGGTLLGGTIASALSGCTTTEEAPKATIAPPAPILPKPPVIPPQKSYSSVRVSGPYLAQTFDDGPHATNTPELLTWLAKNDIKCTFFMIGQNVANNPDIAKQVADQGHEIGNHSYTHPALSHISADQVDSEISRTQEIITKVTGITPKLMRPPYGAFNQGLIQKMRTSYQLTTIFWSVDPEDWKRPGPSVVSDRILSQAKNGSIILSHDIHAPTIQAMYTVIPGLKLRGFQPIPVGQLISMEATLNPPLPLGVAT